MLARYQIQRGQSRSSMPAVLRDGIRHDTRKHTRHILRPTAELVLPYLEDPTAANWRSFKTEYHRILEHRFAEDRTPFDDLAKLAQNADLFLGCSCPTTKNPNVKHCHTWLALEFMRTKYPRLPVLRDGSPGPSVQK